MQFLGVGWQEIVVVIFLMLVFVGPERMPRVAYQIGRAVRTMQQYARAVRDEFSEEIAYVEEQYKTVKGEVDVARTELREQQQKFNSEMREATAPIQELPALASEVNASVSNVVNIADRQPLAAGAENLVLPSGHAQAPSPTSPPAADDGQPPLVF